MWKKMGTMFLMAALVLILPLAGKLGAASSYLEDQTIDQELGLFDLPWEFNLVRVNSRWDQPFQVQSGGRPPYDQEVELAQSFGAPESVRRCFNGQGQQIPC